jgi:hypothetical protein
MKESLNLEWDSPFWYPYWAITRKYNHRVFGIKPSESKSKHFAHRALEVWSTLYPDKPFGPNNKNIISYSMVAMVYAKIELKRKVD